MFTQFYPSFLAIFLPFFSKCYAQIGTCVDSIPALCPSMSYLCTNSIYQSYMTQNCNSTCKLCLQFDSPPVKTTLDPSKCVDTSFTCSSSAYLCNNGFYKTFLEQYCPVTCGFCTPRATPTRVSSGSCVDKSYLGLSCPLVSYMCTIDLYKQPMKESCPKTCGYCPANDDPQSRPTPIPSMTATASGSCIDKTYLGLSCSYVSYMCNIGLYKQQMMESCPKTCGLCSSMGSSTIPSITPLTKATSASCVDKSYLGLNCSLVSYMCTIELYKQQMMESCPKTCGLCAARPTMLAPASSTTAKTATTSGPCLDNTSIENLNCSLISYMCNMDAYKQQMMEWCPKTCGFCQIGQTTKALAFIGPAPATENEDRIETSQAPTKGNEIETSQPQKTTSQIEGSEETTTVGR